MEKAPTVRNQFNFHLTGNSVFSFLVVVFFFMLQKLEEFPLVELQVELEELVEVEWLEEEWVEEAWVEGEWAEEHQVELSEELEVI